MGNSNESETTAVGASKVIPVETEFGTVLVRRLPLIGYAELLRAVRKLPKELGDFVDGTDEEKFKDSSTAETIELLMPVLESSWSDFVGIIAVPTDKDAEFIGNLDAGDAIEVFIAILDLNNYAKVISAIKKLRARGKANQPETPEAAPTEA